MGYGQGFLTQAALLLDRFEDAEQAIEAIGKFCYHHHDAPYVVPEGVICHPDGSRWFRSGDLGNGVQQAEIIKCIRIMIGVDNLSPAKGLSLIPRIPKGFHGFTVRDYPLYCETPQGREAVKIDIDYRSGDELSLVIKCTKKVKWNRIRLLDFSCCQRNFTKKAVKTVINHTDAYTFSFDGEYLDQIQLQSQG